MPSPHLLPGVKHKVIGLVSGGKDSTFNLLHCVANGHELVALATLTPEVGVEELDSHLYQSVGTRLLPLIAESMSLPLFTRDIKGKAVSRGPEYGSRHTSGEGSEVLGDETEDLYNLLKEIRTAHPEVTALASGAILSNYQRLRIEHVCQRLGLVSISYLWQAEQLPLLERMLSCGMEVILVKVAGVGLGVDLVGKDLRDLMPLLRRLESRYGSHPAGEGGEYETITLSTPLFSHRLELVDSEVVITDPEPYPVAYLRVPGGRLEKKESWVRPGQDELREMLGLNTEEGGYEGLDESGRELLQDLRAEVRENPESSGNAGLEDELSLTTEADQEGEKVRFDKKGQWFGASISGSTRAGESIGDELRRCFDAVKETLSNHGLSLALHASHITLLLPSMSLFVPANAVYQTYFGTSPPSRATVAVPLPSRCRIRLEIIGFDDRPEALSQRQGESSGRVDRQALHVQGLSYWAPANIGPYSQAVVVNSRVALAGQIPLIPATLTLPAEDYYHQSILALQHVQRIRDVLRSKTSTGGGWQGWVESCTAWWVRTGTTSGGGLEVVRQAWKLWAEREGCQEAPVVFVQAEELPKGALVEFQVNFHTGRRGVVASAATRGQDYDNDDDDDDEELEAIYASSSERGRLSESCETNTKGQGRRSIVFIDNLSIGNLLAIPSDAISMKVYHLKSTDVAHISSLLNKSGLDLDGLCYTFIPVHSISSRNRSAVIALEIFS